MEPLSATILLKGLYQGLILGIELDQVPHAIRNCLILVHTCYGDLSTLIDLRNEYLDLLESQPRILERMNRIITEARQALQEVCILVEKCRPEAHGGKTPMLNRLNWMFVDSNLFKQKEPILSRQHSAVISELNFLRQLAFTNPMQSGRGTPAPGMGPVGGEGKWKTGPKRKTFTAQDGQALRDMLGIDDELDPARVPSGPSLASQISNLSLGAASLPPPSYTAAPTVQPTVGGIAGSFNALMGQNTTPAPRPGMSALNPGMFHPPTSNATTNSFLFASNTRLGPQTSMMKLRASTPNPGSSKEKMFLSNELVQGIQQFQAEYPAQLQGLDLSLQHGQTMPTGGHGIMNTASHSHYLGPVQSTINPPVTSHDQPSPPGYRQDSGHAWGNAPSEQLSAQPAVAAHQCHVSVTQGGIPYTVGPMPAQVPLAGPIASNVDKPLPTAPVEKPWSVQQSPLVHQLPPTHQSPPVQQPPSIHQPLPAQRLPPVQQPSPMHNPNATAIPKQPRLNPNHAARQRRGSYNPASAHQTAQRQQSWPASQGHSPRAPGPPGAQPPRQQRPGQVQGPKVSGFRPASIPSASNIPRASTIGVAHMAPAPTGSTISSPDLSYQNTGTSQSVASFQWDATLSPVSTGSSLFSDRYQQMSPSPHGTPAPHPPLGPPGLGIHQVSTSGVYVPMERPPSSASVSSRGSVNLGLLHLDNPWEQPQRERPPIESIAELPTENMLKYEVWEMQGDMPAQTQSSNADQVYEAPG